MVLPFHTLHSPWRVSYTLVTCMWMLSDSQIKSPGPHCFLLYIHLDTFSWLFCRCSQTQHVYITNHLCHQISSFPYHVVIALECSYSSQKPSLIVLASTPTSNQLLYFFHLSHKHIVSPSPLLFPIVIVFGCHHLQPKLLQRFPTPDFSSLVQSPHQRQSYLSRTHIWMLHPCIKPCSCSQFI